MNINRILTGAMCAIAILSASGCPRRVPTEPEPPKPAPVVEPGPTDPAPGPTDPAKPAPGPNPAPVVPAPNPVVTPLPTPVVTPTPAPKVTPTPKPKPEPTPEPEPEPTDEQIFAELIREKMNHSKVSRAINEMRGQMFLEGEGWTRGEFETPAEYTENMYKQVDFTFRSIKDYSYERYLEDSQRYAYTSTARGVQYFVDLKRSTANKGYEEFYILRYNPNTAQVIGIKEGTSDYFPGIPTASRVNSQFNSQGAAKGKIFFYALEKNTVFLSQEKRFIRIPEMFFYKDWEDRYHSQAVEQQRVHQQRVYQQRVAQQQFNAQRRAPVYNNTGYPQQSGY